jgi:glycosyltransferase involved in cell wall biosynthesis
MRKIKIVYIITRMIRGGAQKVVLELLRRIDRTRFQPHLITGVQDTKNSKMLDEVKEIDVPFYLVPELFREMRLWHDLRATFRLTGLIRSLRPDILHAHTYKAGVIGCFAGRLSGVRINIFTPHGHIFGPEAQIPGVPQDRLRLGWLYWLIRLASSCADKITSLSEQDLTDHIALRLAPSHKYCIIRNGIELPVSTGGKGWWHQKIQDRYPILGCTGRLTSEKGHRYLIEAMGQIRKRFPKVMLLLAGKGPEEDKLKGLTLKLGLQDTVTFLGEIQDIHLVLSDLDIYVQPSLYESQGLAILEAMFAHKAVIATRVGGVTDVVVDGQTGILIQPHSVQEIVKAVSQLAEDTFLARRMGQAGYDRVIKYHSIDCMVQAYRGLYEELIRKKIPHLAST